MPGLVSGWKIPVVNLGPGKSSLLLLLFLSQSAVRPGELHQQVPESNLQQAEHLLKADAPSQGRQGQSPMLETPSHPTGAQAGPGSPTFLGWGVCRGTAKKVVVQRRETLSIPGSLFIWEQPMPHNPGQCLAQAHTAVAVTWQGAEQEAEGSKSSPCTSPAHAGTSTDPPLETW